MAFPVRCFTCNFVVGKYEEKYFTRLSEGESPKDILDSLNIKRYCCRRMYLAYVNTIDQLILFENPKDTPQESKRKEE